MATKYEIHWDKLRNSHANKKWNEIQVSQRFCVSV